MKMLKTVAIILPVVIYAVLIFGVEGRSAVAARTQDLQTCKVTGVVIDPNEARIVGATIKVENGSFKREVRSDDEGYFEIELPAGTYHMVVEMDGFKKFKLSPFYAKGGAAEHVKVQMKVKPPASTLKV
jgi:hypothetical protein